MWIRNHAIIYYFYMSNVTVPLNKPLLQYMHAYCLLQCCSALTNLTLCLVAEYGLFFADDDQKKGIWLENNRNLEYYLLRSGVRCFFS